MKIFSTEKLFIRHPFNQKEIDTIIQNMVNQGEDPSTIRDYLDSMKVRTIQFLPEKQKNYSKDKDDPCWDGYEQLGMKEKNGKQVPNCIPINK